MRRRRFVNSKKLTWNWIFLGCLCSVSLLFLYVTFTAFATVHGVFQYLECGDYYSHGLSKPSTEFKRKFSFVIAGTWKSGTSSLQRYLRERGDICVAPGEPKFFSETAEYCKGLQWYEQEYFHGCDYHLHQLFGEKSATYLRSKDAARRLYFNFPEILVVVLLRNPVDRVYSAWWMDFCEGRYDADFEQFYLESHTDGSIKAKFRAGQYIRHVQRWTKMFPKSQLLLLSSEEFFSNPRSTLKQVEERLGLQPYFYPDEIVGRTFGSAVTCQRLLGERPMMNASLREKLLAYYQPFNQKLYEFVGNDFHWDS